MIRRPPGSPPFPNTPLVRSRARAQRRARAAARRRGGQAPAVFRRRGRLLRLRCRRLDREDPGLAPERPRRSEEHTSELQSRQYLVCRLLLEKKTIFVFIYFI